MLEKDEILINIKIKMRLTIATKFLLHKINKFNKQNKK